MGSGIGIHEVGRRCRSFLVQGHDDPGSCDHSWRGDRSLVAKKMMRIITAIGVATLAVGGGAFGFMLMDDDPPVIAAEMRVDPDPAIAGTTAWRIVLPDLFFQAELLPLGPDLASIPIVLPEDAPPGPAIHRAFNTYGCNWVQRWIRPIRVPPRDIKFTIAPRQ